MVDIQHKPSLSSSITYRDPKTALRWLEEAFGFEPVMVLLDAEENLVHSQMRFGDGSIMVGNEWSPDHASPASIGGKNTQSVHVHVAADIDGVCERARRTGADIIMEPQDQFYGDRTFRARDLEGHIWTFGQTVRAMTSEAWDAAAGGGITTRERL